MESNAYLSSQYNPTALNKINNHGIIIFFYICVCLCVCVYTFYVFYLHQKLLWASEWLKF